MRGSQALLSQETLQDGIDSALHLSNQGYVNSGQNGRNRPFWAVFQIR
jgi:hypothetical protein